MNTEKKSNARMRANAGVMEEESDVMGQGGGGLFCSRHSEIANTESDSGGIVFTTET
jgi:hypothetical protein